MALPVLDPGADQAGQWSLDRQGGRQCQTRRQKSLGVGAKDAPTIQVSLEGSAQHARQHGEAEDVAQGQAESHQGRPIAGRGQTDGCQDQHHLDGVGDGREDEGMPSVLEGVEGALNEQEGAHGHQPQGQAYQGSRDQDCLVNAHGGQQGTGDGHRNGQHDRSEKEHHQPDIAQGLAQILAGIPNAAVRNRLGQLGEDGRADGNGHQGVWQDEEGVGVLVGAVAGDIQGVALQRGAIVDAGVDYVGQLVDDHHTHAPGRHRSHGSQADAP